MRILHVAPSFAPAWAYGGVPRCAYELCRALVELGEEVTVWTTDACDATRRLATAAQTIDGIVVHRFPNLSNRLAYHRQLYLPRGMYTHAARHLREFDLVHVHSHRHLLQTVVGRAARRAAVPCVFTGHGTVPPIERYVPVKRVIDALGARRFLREAAVCIAVANVERAHYVAAGVDPNRVHVIPNGLRLADYAALPTRGAFRAAHQLGDAPLVLFVGKITPRKGVGVLLHALARLAPAVHLVVAGNFMMPATILTRLTRELGVTDRVRFVGLLTDEAKLAAYVDADVLAYPSHDEIFGLVPFEGVLCGTPPVVCDDSGCGEMVRAADCGLLVPYGDVVALAAALTRLLESAERRAALVANGRRYAGAHLDWSRVAATTRELYRQVLRGATAARRP